MVSSNEGVDVCDAVADKATVARCGQVAGCGAALDGRLGAAHALRGLAAGEQVVGHEFTVTGNRRTANFCTVVTRCDL